MQLLSVQPHSSPITVHCHRAAETTVVVGIGRGAGADTLSTEPVLPPAWPIIEDIIPSSASCCPWWCCSFLLPTAESNEKREITPLPPPPPPPPPPLLLLLVCWVCACDCCCWCWGGCSSSTEGISAGVPEPNREKMLNPATLFLRPSCCFSESFSSSSLSLTSSNRLPVSFSSKALGSPLLMPRRKVEVRLLTV